MDESFRLKKAENMNQIDRMYCAFLLTFFFLSCNENSSPRKNSSAAAVVTASPNFYFVVPEEPSDLGLTAQFIAPKTVKGEFDPAPAGSAPRPRPKPKPTTSSRSYGSRLHMMTYDNEIVGGF